MMSPAASTDRMPFTLDKGELLLAAEKPRFLSYTPALFAMGIGGMIFIIFLLAGAFIIGLVILVALVVLVRWRLWTKAGYWFTDRRIIINDGSKTMMIPYDEIALSSLAFDNAGLMFSTVYGREHAIRGVKNSKTLVALITGAKQQPGPPT